MSGRFAPSPTGALHLGNLRTAILAAASARAGGRGFLVRMEDLDRVTARPEHEAGQLADLAALGITWAGPVVRQSERFATATKRPSPASPPTVGLRVLLHPARSARRRAHPMARCRTASIPGPVGP
ncbi:MAG: glutamate--tRNA ligase family protein [Ilumatobacteraceae bacterium]